MVVYNFSRHNSLVLGQDGDGWNPSVILGIINPDTRGFTCVGYAPSKGRRCQNPIAKHNRDAVFALLDVLENLPSDSRTVAKMLPKIASLSLCLRNHQGQADEMTSSWQSKISSMKPSSKKTHSRRADEDANSFSRTDFRAKLRETQRTTNQTRSPSPEPVRARAKPSPGSETTHKNKTREPEQAETHERREKQKADQQEPNRQKDEQEKRQKKEREERAKAAEKRREAEEAAQKIKEWQEAWKTYQQRWSEFKSTKPTDAQAQAPKEIPWPVKSGLRSDVKASSVREFFRKACPDAADPALMYRALQLEVLKWHTDKIFPLLKEGQVGVVDKVLVDMVVRVVIEVRAEAQVARDKAR